jgi:hypothetical protein
VERVAIDPATGARALAACPRRRQEYFLAGTVPEETCPSFGFARSSKRGGASDRHGRDG